MPRAFPGVAEFDPHCFRKSRNGNAPTLRWTKQLAPCSIYGTSPLDSRTFRETSSRDGTTPACNRHRANPDVLQRQVVFSIGLNASNPDEALSGGAFP